MTLQLTSSAFDPGKGIPVRYTGEGADVSPPLSWGGVPSGTRALALICEDPDAPTPRPWVHWLITGIAPEAGGLAEDVAKRDRPDAPPGAVQGRNSWGRPGYGGPMPPPGHGVHHYHFTLFAVDKELDLPPGFDKAALEAAMRGHVIGQGKLVGTYERR